MHDDEIAAVRKARHEISAECGHDVHKVAAHYRAEAQQLKRSSDWVSGTVGMGPEILDRMELAVAKVRERLLRATDALNRAAIPYAVVGGNAVAHWVASVDEGAVRNTRDVDLLVRQSDHPAILTALQTAGFEYREDWFSDVFVDGLE